ncbi:MAG: cytosolic protein, partial [Desulfonatronovibrio sp. MSAO_Bac4]
ALKFGPIPEDKQRLIESADSQKLRQWSERILTAQSMDEVLNDS